MKTVIISRQSSKVRVAKKSINNNDVRKKMATRFNSEIEELKKRFQEELRIRDEQVRQSKEEARQSKEEARALEKEFEALKRQTRNEPTHSQLDVESLVNFMTYYELLPFIATSEDISTVLPLCHSFGGFNYSILA